MALLGLDERLDVVGWAEDGPRAIELARELEPDIVLMDIALPGLDGIRATRQILDAGIRTTVIMLTNVGSEENVRLAREAGAAAFVTKDRSAADLFETIFEVASLAMTFGDAAGRGATTEGR